MKNNKADVWGFTIQRSLKHRSSVLTVRQPSGRHDPRQAHLAFRTCPLPSGLVTIGIGPCTGGGILEPVWGLKSWFCHCITVSLWGVIYFLCASVSSLIKWGISKYLCLVIIHGACAKSLQSCATLWYAMDCSLPVSSVHGDSPGKTSGVGCCALL